MSSNESSNMSFQHKQQEIEVLQQKVNAARTAVNVITIFAIFIALFMGVMLGVFNAAEPTEGMSENIHFLLGFSFIFFIIAIPSMIFNLLVKRSIAQPGLWKQALVWVYGILLLPLFPMGTAAAAVILYAQVSWMRTANT
jgi:uncharacterized membrane protein